MTTKNDKMSRSRALTGLVAGIILAVLGALMIAEGIITMLGNSPFIFIENMNRGFEIVVGFVTILLAGTQWT